MKPEKPDLIWSATLGELQLQMTQATFDTWLRGTKFLRLEDGAFVVGVKNAYARDWLEHRLLVTIERTLARLAGRLLGVRFEIDEAVAEEAEDLEQAGEQLARTEAAAASASFELPSYDVHDAGWFKVGEYERRFWVPALGRVAWGVIEVIRKEDRRKKKSEWTPSKRYSAPALAEQVPCGRQALLGVNRSCEAEDLPGLRDRYDVAQDDGRWRYYQPGAFDHLQELGLAQIERRGDGRHTTYWISVRNQLGLLPPALAMALPSRLQVQHDQWLADHDFDAREWDIESGGKDEDG
jgi:hypothetical protein